MDAIGHPLQGHAQVARHEIAATTPRAGTRASASSLRPRRVGPFFLFSVLQLGTQVARSEYRPPFTLGVMVAQTLSYLRPGWLKLFLRVGRPVRPAGIPRDWLTIGLRAVRPSA